MATRNGLTDAQAGPGQDCVLAFAKAVAVPGTGRLAMYIDSDNRNAGWATLSEAVASGRAFCVPVAPDVLAVDCDDPDLEYRVQALADRLRRDGLAPVLLASGHPGHLHLFCRIYDPALLKRYRDHQAHVRGLDVRGRIRPPLAPHRGTATPSLSSVRATLLRLWQPLRRRGTQRSNLSRIACTGS
jgi:hypothetical protein